MSGLRLTITRPLPPPPYGFAYLTNEAGAILTDPGGKLMIVPYFPVVFDLLVDEDGNALTDEDGAHFIAEQD